MILLQRRKTKGLICSALLLTTMCAQSGTMGVLEDASNYYKNFEFSVAGGANWYSVPDTNVAISPFETDSIQVNHISTGGAWKAGIGYYLFEDTLSPQSYLKHLLFEMNVYQTFTNLSGSVWQFDRPEFNNYDFKAPVTSTRLMFDFKPSFFAWDRVSPYAILGIGATWNTVSYSETATGASINRNSALSLSNNTTAQVAWDTGAGVRVALTEHLSATAEYIHSFLGHASPANKPDNDVSLSTPPRFSLQTQSLLVGLSVRL